MNAITNVFNYGGFNVRTVVQGGEPWFVAVDVCEILEIANSRDALRRLDDDEKGVATNDTPGGKQQLSILNESGLYSLVMTSRKADYKQRVPSVTQKSSNCLNHTTTPASIVVSMFSAITT